MLGVVFEETFSDRTLVDEKIAMLSLLLSETLREREACLRHATQTTIAQNY
ncbi:hypothetical protein [Nostoc sp. CALU 1950]|uniref:hypothetical protein n=1 Tax=Nostoc sp. CALU 1950 TaxID=3104321 RepID=UPI003EB78022